MRARHCEAKFGHPDRTEPYRCLRYAGGGSALDPSHEYVGSIVNWDECLQHAEVSDIGMRRTTNQDAYEVVLASDDDTWRRRGHLFVVADGMGAHAAGELASEMAVSGIALRYFKYENLAAAEALHKSILDTNTEVYQRGQANLDFYNMGTTASVLALVPQGALVAHVGDSRVYRLRRQQLDQLTFDHSLVWELRQSGQLSEDSELARVVPKNIITRSVGPNANVHPDLEGPFPVEVGDTFLLCSDGLSGPVEDNEIGAILGSFPPQEAAQALIDLANLRGGPDNITAIVVRVTGAAIASRQATVEQNTMAHKRAPRPVHSVVWIVTGVGLLAAIALSLIEQWRWALVGALAAAGALGFAALQRWGFGASEIEPPTVQRHGKGPYTSIRCDVSSEFLAELNSITTELRAAAIDEKWDVDLGHFDQSCQRAKQSSTAGHPVDALRHFTAAITSMMTELRRQKRP